MSGVTDVHVHLAALPEPGNGCRISRRMLRNFATRFVAWAQGLPLNDPARANALYEDALNRELAASKRVAKAVLLGMDGAYDSSGNLDEAHTEFLISNDHVFTVAARNPRLLPGVSVNPARRDAIDELERCARRGAVLVKVLPNAQLFNPSLSRHRPFYRALARLGLPLLSHVGCEYTLIGHDQSAGDPKALVTALEEGATVIAAHGCTSGSVMNERHLPTLLELARRYPKFYTDLSALTLPNRVGGLLRLRRYPQLRERFLFGTDYPLPCYRYPCLLAGKWGGFKKAGLASNRFDRQAEVLEALGLGLGADFDRVLASARV